MVGSSVEHKKAGQSVYPINRQQNVNLTSEYYLQGGYLIYIGGIQLGLESNIFSSFKSFI